MRNSDIGKYNQLRCIAPGASASWECFKLMVNGTLVYLIRPGAKSIDITLKTTVPLDSAQLFTEVF